MTALNLDAVDGLMVEYATAAAQVDQLAAQLRQATAERNAVLAALSEAGLTQQAITARTGLTITQLRTGLHNDWLARYEGATR